jgi:hypothetical protein
VRRMVFRVPVRVWATVALACAVVATASGMDAAMAGARGSGPPVETALPAIHGKTVDGGKLHAATGKWSGGTPITDTFEWERCNTAGAECEAIGGATSARYKATTADVGHKLVVAETATNGEGSDTERSAPSATIAAVAPKHKGRLSPTGEAVDGRVMSVGTGTWKGTTPLEYSYQWLRCTHGCHAIEGATSADYRVQTADIGDRLQAVVTATNAAGSASHHSTKTAKVVPGSPLNTALPRVSGTPLVGQTLTAENGTWVGTPPIEYAYQWYACTMSGCEAIVGQTEATHSVGLGELGDSFEVEVIATNAQGKAAATSEQTNLVGGNAPVNTEAPSISGTATAGQLLTAGSGKWAGGEPITFEYEWLRCNTSGGGCVQAAAASPLSVYLVAAADVGHTLRVKVTATNLAGKGEAESGPTATVGGVLPSNTLAPSVLGLDITGQTLTANEGLWTGTEPIAYAFQWQRCSKAGTECANLAEQTGTSYVLQSGDAGHTIRVVVTAENVAGAAEKESAATLEVAGVGPSNTEAPAISGTATAGQLLTASSGKWSGTEPIAYEYEWLRCNAAGGECAQAAAASLLPIYTVAAADVGHTLRVKVLAKNIAGSASAESEPTATVGGVLPSNVLAPTVLGLDITGQTLTASEGTWTGTEPITYSFQWQQCSKAGTECGNIGGASKSSYVIQNGDAGHTLRVVVTAKNVAGSVEKESATTLEVAGVGPESTEAPGISGNAKEGELLTASSGKWSGTEPILYEYEWLRCNMTGGECTQAAAASVLPTYPAAAADVGHTLRVKVLAKNIAGSAAAESDKTGPVVGVAPTNLVLPVTVPLVTVTEGGTVTATEGTWTGTQPITYVYEWSICTSATSCKVEQKGVGSSFKVPSGTTGKKLRVKVIATNAAGKGEKEALELTILL